MEHLEYLKHSFKEAIKFEEYGRAFFTKASRDAKSPMAQEIFRALADEELKHITRIKDVFSKLVSENNWPAQTPASDNAPWKHIFRDALEHYKDIIKQGVKDLEAIKLGLDFESKGYKFYDEMAKKSGTPVEKKFFEILRDEEEGHYLVIENLKKYMENPVDWFGEEEHHIFEG